jgi:hypothetical protein
MMHESTDLVQGSTITNHLLVCNNSMKRVLPVNIYNTKIIAMIVGEKAKQVGNMVLN